MASTTVRAPLELESLEDLRLSPTELLGMTKAVLKAVCGAKGVGSHDTKEEMVRRLCGQRTGAQPPPHQEPGERHTCLDLLFVVPCRVATRMHSRGASLCHWSAVLLSFVLLHLPFPVVPHRRQQAPEDRGQLLLVFLVIIVVIVIRVVVIIIIVVDVQGRGVAPVYRPVAAPPARAGGERQRGEAGGVGVAGKLAVGA